MQTEALISTYQLSSPAFPISIMTTPLIQLLTQKNFHRVILNFYFTLGDSIFRIYAEFNHLSAPLPTPTKSQSSLAMIAVVASNQPFWICLNSPVAARMIFLFFLMNMESYHLILLMAFTSIWFIFKDFYFFISLNYILLTLLPQPSQFSPFAPSTHHPHSLRQYPHHCSCPWVTCISSLATPMAFL